VGLLLHVSTPSWCCDYVGFAPLAVRAADVVPAPARGSRSSGAPVCRADLDARRRLAGVQHLTTVRATIRGAAAPREHPGDRTPHLAGVLPMKPGAACLC
jgi:hypothetical protein